MAKEEQQYPWISFLKARLNQHKWMYIVFGIVFLNVVAGFVFNHFSNEQNAGLIPSAYTMYAGIAYMAYMMIVHFAIYMTSDPDVSSVSDAYVERNRRICKKFKAISLA